MVDKTGRIVTTSVTLIDVHDIARSCRTYGAQSLFVAHPSQNVRALVRTLHNHWNDGFGAQYNPNRQDALSILRLASSLDEAIMQLDSQFNTLPKLVATSARPGPDRISYAEMRAEMKNSAGPFLLMFGTGWGMSDELMNRADFTLAPINGPTPYNHLSVRAACAIILDRLLSLDER